MTPRTKSFHHLSRVKEERDWPRVMQALLLTLLEGCRDAGYPPVLTQLSYRKHHIIKSVTQSQLALTSASSFATHRHVPLGPGGHQFCPRDLCRLLCNQEGILPQRRFPLGSRIVKEHSQQSQLQQRRHSSPCLMRQRTHPTLLLAVHKLANFCYP